jgi:hypothetical protein
VALTLPHHAGKGRNVNSKTAHDFWDRLLDAHEATRETLSSNIGRVTLMLAALVLINFTNLILRIVGLV